MKEALVGSSPGGAPTALDVRTRLKRLLEGAAAGSGLHHVGRWRRRGQTLVLTYHNVVPDPLVGTGDSSLHISLSRFRQHLELVMAEAQPVALPDLLSRGEATSPSRPNVVITFDDAYRGALELAVPELERRGLSATLFVSPGLLGGQTLWWDAMAKPGFGAPPPTLRARVLDEGDGSQESARSFATMTSVPWETMPPLLRTASEEELALAAASPGVTVASHTWSHPSLPRLSRSDLMEELVRSRDWLRDRFPGRYVDALSFPFGRHSPGAASAAADAGYRTTWGLQRGWIQSRDFTASDPLPRRNVPAGISPDGLRLRLAWR